MPTGTTDWFAVGSDTYVDENDDGAGFSSEDHMKMKGPGTTNEKAALIQFRIGSPADLGIATNAVVTGVDIRWTYDTHAYGNSVVTWFVLNNAFSAAVVDWATTDGTTTWTPDRDGGGSSVEYSGQAGIESTFTQTGATKTTNLTAGFTDNHWTFGDTVSLIGYTTNEHGGGGAATTGLVIKSTEFGTDASRPKYRVTYTVPPPTKPVMTVTATDLGDDAYINITKHSVSEDLTHYSFNVKVGAIAVSHADKHASKDKADTGTDRWLVSDLFSAIIPSSYATLPYATWEAAFAMWGEDSLNVNDDGAKSNTVVVISPKVAAATCKAYTGYADASAPTGGTELTDPGGGANVDIGEPLALRVVSDVSGGASKNHNGKFTKVYVNWDAGVSDTLEDYTVYEMSDGVSDTSTNLGMEFKYTTAGAKVIKVRIKDEDGFISGKQALVYQPLVTVGTPKANLTLSRTKALTGKYADRNTAIVLSGAQSHPIGSDRKLTNYMFTYKPHLTLASNPSAYTICTANSLNNDNSVFDEVSKQLTILAAGAYGVDLAATNFTIFGLASFTSAGAAVADDQLTFNNYKYTSETITPNGTRLTVGESAGADLTANYFKSVECVVCKALDGDDFGSRYFLWVATPEEVSVTAIDDGSGINSSVTSIVTDSAVDLSVGDVIKIDDEKMLITAISSVTLTVIRGYAHTTAASHDDDDAISRVSKWKVNEELRVVGNSDDTIEEKRYSWGGLAKVIGTALTVDSASDYITLASTTSANSTHADNDWYSQGFNIGDLIRVKSPANGTYASPQYNKVIHIEKVGNYYTRLYVAAASGLLNEEELDYVNYAGLNAESGVTMDIIRHDNGIRPTLTATAYNVGAQEDEVIFHLSAMDDYTTGASTWYNNVDTDKAIARFSDPKTLDLDALVDSGDIAILGSSLNRQGGMAPAMPLGERKYPIGSVRTKAGMPKVTANLRLLTQTGFSEISSLIDSDAYDFVFLDSRKISDPTQPYRTYRMRLEGGSLDRDPSLATQYLATCNFVVIGEDASA